MHIDSYYCDKCGKFTPKTSIKTLKILNVINDTICFKELCSSCYCKFLAEVEHYFNYKDIQELI